MIVDVKERKRTTWFAISPYILHIRNDCTDKIKIPWCAHTMYVEDNVKW